MIDQASQRSERGAVLVIAALLLTALMAVAAIVVDLGNMRGMRSANQTAVDFAALAAGEALSHPEGPDAQTACVDAVRYLRLNADGLEDLDIDCAQLPSVCIDPNPFVEATDPEQVSDSTDDYDVIITYPVAKELISDPSTTGGARITDGTRCERMMVEVEQRSSTYFAGVIGWDEVTTRARAVVRQIPERADQVPSLWLLDPYGCDVLTVQGGAQVTAGVPGFGGLISLDSDGMGTQGGTGCGGNSFTVDVGGSGSLLEAFPTDVYPPGRITLYAMWPGQDGCGDPDGNVYACDPSDVANDTLQPEPTRRPRRATRAPVDHQFNCRTDDTPITSYPDYHGLPIEQCAGGSGDYIDQLRRGVGETGAPAGFNTLGGGDCSGRSEPLVLDGNWFVDCSNFRVDSGSDVTFNGGNVIFDGGIQMNGGTLTFNSANPNENLSEECLSQITWCLDESSAQAAWVYLRSGDIVLTGGSGLVINQTAVYQHDGHFRIAGGSPPIWSAPTEGPFTSLSVWSEQESSRYNINGGASMELTGIFFTPEARPFSLSGGAPLLPQQAQFISYRAAIAGGAILTLAPLEIDPVVIPPPEALLIR